MPLFGETDAARAVTEMITEAATARRRTSPARTFVAELGSTEVPDDVVFCVDFRDAENRVRFEVQVDSSKASWMTSRHGGGRWRPCTPTDLIVTVPRDEIADYVLLVGKELERGPIETWVRALLWR